MRPFYLLVIACIFGAIIVLASAMILTSPVLLPDSVKVPSRTVQYGLDTSLPEPRYYTGIDFGTLKSNDHLTVIPLKSYRQQATNYSCGAVAAMTVISYYGQPVNNTDADEVRIAHEMNRNVSDTTGINQDQIVSWFHRNGWNATWKTGGSRQMLRENLKNGIPTMVERMD